MSYVIITPVRNEERFLPLTLASVTSQRVRPAQWIIVDDGSTDRTAQLVAEVARRHPWIRLVSLDHESPRQRGARVAQLFYVGYGQIDVSFDFIVKLDGDLSFDACFFEHLLGKFAENPLLGIAGGQLYTQRGDRWYLERTPADHVRGATKVYRRACFDDIGGLPVVNGWDSIDEWRAQMRGWVTHEYADLPVLHHRPTGALEGRLAGYVRQGEFAHFLGYPWIAVLARGAYRGLIERPLILAGAAIVWGYLSSWWARKPQFDDPELRSFVRRKQIGRVTTALSRLASVAGGRS